uniref:Uncharacterized protein n=1 Tax=Phakopsora pachyrhizi TaxID=170000 RepID=A0A0S1MIC7_PHAPC
MAIKIQKEKAMQILKYSLSRNMRSFKYQVEKLAKL